MKERKKPNHKVDLLSFFDGSGYREMSRGQGGTSLDIQVQSIETESGEDEDFFLINRINPFQRPAASLKRYWMKNHIEEASIPIHHIAK
jgi:hypothetical protein